MGNKVCLMDFWAEWCGPCKRLSPIVDEVADHFVDKIEVMKINVGIQDEVASEWNIMNIPALIITVNGVEKDRHVGMISKENLIKWVEDYIE